MDQNFIKIKKINEQLAAIAQQYKNDFFITSTIEPWVNAAIASGTFAGAAGTAKHPGVVTLLSSTSANSGHRVNLYAEAFLLGGGEKTTGIFKVVTCAGTTVRFGFHDTTSEADVNDGVYIEIAETTLTGKTANAGTRSTTATNYTITENTWYRFVIEVNSDATLITYSIYADDSGTALWIDTLATNIPTGANRYCGQGIVATNSGTTALSLVSLDYMDIALQNARRLS